IGTGHGDPQYPGEAQSLLRITVKAADPQRVGKSFTSRVIEPVLSCYPGYFPTTPPTEPTPYGIYWPTRCGSAAFTVMRSSDCASPGYCGSP
ncbi:MAG: hypothetical protein ACKOE2_09850, partial [Actinomycetales bacterium]